VRNATDLSEIREVAELPKAVELVKAYDTYNVSQKFHIETLVELWAMDAVGDRWMLWGSTAYRSSSLPICSRLIVGRSSFLWSGPRMGHRDLYLVPKRQSLSPEVEVGGGVVSRPFAVVHDTPRRRVGRS
jgi:hypothetical protein